jgi:hypothetical protein
MPANQLNHAALRLLSDRPDLFFHQGHVAATWRYRNGQRFGPYYRLAYRLDGRQHSIYLGRAGELVDRVRQQLASLQLARIEHRAVRRLERDVRRALHAEKLHMNALLRPYGLRLKGFEIRGWRLCTFRRFLPRRRSLLPRFSPLKSPATPIAKN